MGFSHARRAVAGENQSMPKPHAQRPRKPPPDKKGWGVARLAELLAIIALVGAVLVIAYVAMQLL